MSRRTSKHLRPARPLRLDSAQTCATKADGQWIVRAVRSGTSVKHYLCPQCNQLIAAGAAHVVAWPHTPPLGSTSGLDYRRHFHTACWQRRH